MSLLLITNPPTVLALDTDWNLLLTRSNANMLGHGLSIPVFTLTNWDSSTGRPEIAQGSIIEVGGSFYQADSDTALVDDAGLIDGTVHIKLVPSGEATPLTLSPVLTNDVIPAWDANKAGWYTSNVKYLPFEMEKAGAVYSGKGEFVSQSKGAKISSDGNLTVIDQNMTGTMKWKYYYEATSPTSGEVFAELNSWVPTNEGYMPLHGALQLRGPVINLYRVNATQIRIYYKSKSTATISFTVATLGAANIVESIKIMSNFDEEL